MSMHADGGQTSRNPNGSTGPRSAEGKERVKYNAVRHGLTARNVLLPGDDPEEYQARIDDLKQDLGTRNRYEEQQVERAVQAAWMADRAIRSETAWLTERMLTEPAAQVLKLTLDADSLFQRLMFDRRGPTEMYASRDYEHKQPRTSASGEPVDEDRPFRVVAQLEATVPGCQVLLKTWGQLGGVLRRGRGWQSPDKLKAIRLLGFQPMDALSSDEVAVIFLAAHVIEPQSRYAFQELRCEIPEDQFKQFKARVERREFEEITPPDATAARAVLLEIVDTATERLRKLEAEHQRVADQLEPLQQDILRRDRSKFGEQYYRVWGSCDRAHHRHVDAIHRLRRNEAQGWGTVRSERAQRREEKRRDEERWRAAQADPRLVLDEHGTVRYAFDYDGDVEAGLARYEGRSRPTAGQANAASGANGAEQEISGVVDRAPSEPTAVVGGLSAGVAPQADAGGVKFAVEAVQDRGGDVGQTIDVAPGFDGDSRIAGTDGRDPVIVAGKGEAANVQNKVPPVARTEGGVPRGEERTLESSLSSPQSGTGDVTTQSVATREDCLGSSTEGGVRRAEERTSESSLSSPQSGMGDVTTQSVATREVCRGAKGEERMSESWLGAPQSGIGDVATQSVATREGGRSVAEGERADPVIVADKGETANNQNEVPPQARTEDGGRSTEERTREIPEEVRAHSGGRDNRVHATEPVARGEVDGNVMDGARRSDQPWNELAGGLPDGGADDSPPGDPPPVIRVSGTGGG